jgi:hypothetical protein
MGYVGLLQDTYISFYLFFCACLCGIYTRFVKGERFFADEAQVVTASDIGSVVPYTDEMKTNVSNQSRDEESKEKSAESIPTFQARIVGQGYKQVYMCM